MGETIMTKECFPVSHEPRNPEAAACNGVSVAAVLSTPGSFPLGRRANRVRIETDAV